MRINTAFVVLGLLLVAAPFHRFAFAEEDEYGGEDDEVMADGGDKDVVVLTSSNFESVIKGSKFALVEFYAPWCGHCKQLAPHYAKAATKLKSTNPDVVIAKVDATEEPELGKQYAVQGYPTLKWFVDGDLSTASDYNGGRDEPGIVSWIKKKTGPLAIAVDSAASLAELEESDAVILLGYFSAAEGAEYDTFLSAARKSEDIKFVYTTSEEVASAAGLKSAPSFALIKNYAGLGEEREVIPYDSDVTTEAIGDFLLAQKLPLSIEFAADASERIFKSGISKQLIMWTSADDLAPGAKAITTFRDVSRKFRGKLVFVTSNSESAEAEPITNFFGLAGRPTPVIMGFEAESNKKFRMETEFNAANLEAFAASIVDGTAVADFKSAPIPEGEAALEGGVTIIVGKTVDKIVKDESKDVLLEVYAPWCGHCKQLDPIYKKLAKRFKKIDSVVIAKMDGTENEHPDIEIKGYPTLILFPAGKGSAPIPYEGSERTLKALTKFIKTNANIPFELPKKDQGSKEHSDKDEL